MHNTNIDYRQVKAEQVYIKSKCEHSVLLDTVIVGHSNVFFWKGFFKEIFFF